MENGIYEILIEKTYKLYGLEKYDICRVTSDLIKRLEKMFGIIFISIY